MTMLRRLSYSRAREPEHCITYCYGGVQEQGPIVFYDDIVPNSY